MQHNYESGNENIFRTNQKSWASRTEKGETMDGLLCT